MSELNKEIDEKILENMNKFKHVAGVDEAGAGPLAGDLVVAACILDPDNPIMGLNDSKKLTEKRREALYPEIIEKALDYCIINIALIFHFKVIRCLLTSLLSITKQ